MNYCVGLVRQCGALRANNGLVGRHPSVAGFCGLVRARDRHGSRDRSPSYQNTILSSRSSNGDEVELAVFRFTLGIPGFDDALIPRVVGILVGMLLVVNRALSAEYVSDSQVLTEILGMILAGMGIAAPTLQKRLEDVTPGKGRKPPLETVMGGSNAFALDDSLSEKTKEDLAWASFCLLKNANVCGVVVLVDGLAVTCRGILGNEVSGAADILEKARLSLVSVEQTNKVLDLCSNTGYKYLETRSDVENSVFAKCAIIPSGAGGVVCIPVASHIKEPVSQMQSKGYILLICDRERAMSPKELAWCTTIGSKLYTSFQTNSSNM
eukprot:jgi/Picsp_1/6775/NSC_04115-R1_protein